MNASLERVGVKCAWQEIDTQGAELMSDESLLYMIQQVEAFDGWGLVCELAKRYARAKGVVRVPR